MSAPPELDAIMERASQALVRMDYLRCEALCLKALTAAGAASDWAYYQRILLPLQECRRHRRQIAGDGIIRLGTADLSAPVERWLDQFTSGCIVLTRPHTADTARRLADLAAGGRRFIEVLLTDNPPEAPVWSICTHRGSTVRVARPAPPPEWRDHWLAPGAGPATASATLPLGVPAASGPAVAAASGGPADWFLDAAEALGDAALAGVRAPLGSVQRVLELEGYVRSVPDHELLHQALTQVAHRLCLATPGSGSDEP